MNVANLQLEGLMMAVASVNNALEDVSPANRDAIRFPMRLLQIANNSQGESDIPPFSELAKIVGQTKEPYNDQM